MHVVRPVAIEAPLVVTPVVNVALRDVSTHAVQAVAIDLSRAVQVVVTAEIHAAPLVVMHVANAARRLDSTRVVQVAVIHAVPAVAIEVMHVVQVAVIEVIHAVQAAAIDLSRVVQAEAIRVARTEVIVAIRAVHLAENPVVLTVMIAAASLAAAPVERRSRVIETDLPQAHAGVLVDAPTKSGCRVVKRRVAARNHGRRVHAMVEVLQAGARTKSKRIGAVVFDVVVAAISRHHPANILHPTPVEMNGAVARGHNVDLKAQGEAVDATIARVTIANHVQEAKHRRRVIVRDEAPRPVQQDQVVALAAKRGANTASPKRAKSAPRPNVASNARPL